MLDAVIRFVIRSLLLLRYRITVAGLRELSSRDNRGILFLPNHPALIDPVIMLVTLNSRFRVGVLADKAQVDRPLIRFLARRAGVKEILDPTKDRDAGGQIRLSLKEMVAGLNRGQAFLLYPSGHIYRQRFEDLGGNSAVETLVRECPNIRVVLARTHGLWGSSFGWASGSPPSIGRALKRGVRSLLASGVLFAPRRKVRIEFSEPTDFPRSLDRIVINRYLERFYNEGAPPNTYVPYSIWEAGHERVMPEPSGESHSRYQVEIPALTRRIVEAHLREVTGMAEIRPEMRLAHDLGLDSLARVELQVWIEAEFGFPQSDGDSLVSVADLLAVASGEGARKGLAALRPVGPRWFEGFNSSRLSTVNADTITKAFLDAAARNPDQIIVADQSSGAKSYRDLITAISVLKPRIERLQGETIGVMLPASVAATVATLSILFAGKTPVMINWTTGPRGVEHCLDLLGIKHVLSAQPLLKKLHSEGFDKAERVLSRITYLDELAHHITFKEKLRAAYLSRTSWKELRGVDCPKFVTVLFTSGSENLPKAVPLTSLNILTNINDVLNEVTVLSSDVMLGMLPPFHSFGLTANMLLPLVIGLRVVFHPNPTEAAKLAAIIEHYKATLLVGTPTFLSGIVNAAKPSQLTSLRLAVTGAEKCPARVYDALRECCPKTVVIEGYGITECSPIVSANRPGRERRETIGEPLPSVETAIVDPDTLEQVKSGERGLLLVRGPSVFEGYLKYDGESPFIEHAGKSWYRTGDLVRELEHGNLEFLGRMKRFVKLGGEMISLPAIESVLERALGLSNESGPSIAIEAAPGEHPELTLFTTIEVERAEVNRHLRDAGLSPLHNIRQVRKLENIPLLGSGKTDYRALRVLLLDG